MGWFDAFAATFIVNKENRACTRGEILSRRSLLSLATHWPTEVSGDVNTYFRAVSQATLSGKVLVCVWEVFALIC